MVTTPAGVVGKRQGDLLEFNWVVVVNDSVDD